MVTIMIYKRKNCEDLILTKTVAHDMQYYQSATTEINIICLVLRPLDTFLQVFLHWQESRNACTLFNEQYVNQWIRTNKALTKYRCTTTLTVVSGEITK